MTSDTAAEYLLQVTMGRMAELNAHPDMIAAGLELTADPNRDAEDSSPWRRLKIGDRARCPDGLMVCFVPIGDRLVRRLTGALVDVELSVRVICYMRGVKDPEHARRAKHALASVLTSILSGLDAVQTEEGTLYAGRIVARDYASGVTSQGETLHVVALDWQGDAYITE